MSVRNIVIGQKVKPELAQRAKELRRKMTEEEKILWRHLRNDQLGGYHFRRQQIIDGYVVDFYCHAAALVVEVDGPIHEQQVERDKERDAKLAARGLRVVRFKNAEIRNHLQHVLAQILALCREATQEEAGTRVPLALQERERGAGQFE